MRPNPSLSDINHRRERSVSLLRQRARNRGGLGLREGGLLPLREVDKWCLHTMLQLQKKSSRQALQILRGLLGVLSTVIGELFNTASCLSFQVQIYSTISSPNSGVILLKTHSNLWVSSLPFILGIDPSILLKERVDKMKAEALQNYASQSETLMIQRDAKLLQLQSHRVHIEEKQVSVINVQQ